MSPSAPRAITAATPKSTPARPVALLFPGQGSQHVRMAAGLYGTNPAFSTAMDSVLDQLGTDGRRLRDDWLSEQPAISIDDVRRAQPLLFAVDYALGRMVMSWGAHPAAFLGHSAGELVGAVFAGIVELADATAMMRTRVWHAARMPPGGMLAVAASEAWVRSRQLSGVAIAAVNASQHTMLAGAEAPLARAAARLRADGITVVTVPSTVPFHSPAMWPAVEAVEADCGHLPLRPPAIPIYSGYTGAPMTDAQATDHGFWARQLTDTVYFGPALDRLLSDGDFLIIEAGPRQTLSTFTRRHPAVRRGASVVVPLLPARPMDPDADRHAVATAAARLREEGHGL